MKKYKNVFMIICLISFSMITTLIFAQVDLNTNAFKQGDSAPCFDYYKPDNLSINLTQDYLSYESGSPVYIKGVIKNNNSYPMIGMDIKARVVKKISKSKVIESEIVILQDFDIATKINIDSGSEYNINYSYLLPLNAPSGEYEIYFYAVEQNRYNISGLPYENLAGLNIKFDVKGKNPDHVYLDQNKITINNKPYDNSYLKTENFLDEKIPVSIVLHNPSQESKEMTIEYRLYSNNDLNPENFINSKTEKVTILPNSDKILKYTINDSKLPLYHLSITAKSNNLEKNESIFKESSISNIRFSTKDNNVPQINFSGID